METTTAKWATGLGTAALGGGIIGGIYAHKKQSSNPNGSGNTLGQVAGFGTAAIGVGAMGKGIYDWTSNNNKEDSDKAERQNQTQQSTYQPSEESDNESVEDNQEHVVNKDIDDAKNSDVKNENADHSENEEFHDAEEPKPKTWGETFRDMGRAIGHVH